MKYEKTKLGLTLLIIMLLPMVVYAMEQGIAGAIGNATSESISLLVPVASKILMGFIPIILAAHLVIVHTTYWRRDNREDGNSPFSKKVIRERVYELGRNWGVPFQVFGQFIIYHMLDFRFNVEDGLWHYDTIAYVVVSVGMLIVAWFFTGMFARLCFDAWMIRLASRAPKSERARRWHKWLTVEHRPPTATGQADDPTPFAGSTGVPHRGDSEGDDPDKTCPNPRGKSQ